MALRVIAGEFGGRLLQSTRGRGTRPLRGEVREALFNVLGDRVVDACVWDLFAGTGSSGIEALSRGAKHVVFVEKSNQALAVLRENLGVVGDSASDCAEVQKGDAWVPDIESADDSPPDLIFLDPPYQAVAEDPVRSACRAADLAARLAPEGMVCFHFEEGALDEDDFDCDLTVELRNWGRTTMALIQRPLSAVES